MTVTTAPVHLRIHGREIAVNPGTTVAAALLLAGVRATRISVSGELRAPLCGMGICQECRMRIDGRVRLACQTLCQPGMVVESMR